MSKRKEKLVSLLLAFILAFLIISIAMLFIWDMNAQEEFLMKYKCEEKHNTSDLEKAMKKAGETSYFCNLSNGSLVQIDTKFEDIAPPETSVIFLTSGLRLIAMVAIIAVILAIVFKIVPNMNKSKEEEK